MNQLETQLEQDSGDTQEAHPQDTIVIHTTPEKLKEAERQLLEIQNLNAVPESLGKYSLRACIFQFTQAAVLFYFASQSDTEWYWYTSFPVPTTESLSSPPKSPDPKEVARFSILWFSPIFIVMSGIEHFCCLYFRDKYLYYIARNQNPYRWTEYSFSASLMKVMIAQFAGVTDVHLLFCLFILTALMIQLGGAHEVFNAKARADGHPQNWRCFFLSWLANLATWGIIFSYFGSRVAGGGQPAFIWAIMIVIFLLDSSFAIVFTLQWSKIPPFDDYVAGERAFIVLSFVSKTLMAWVGFGGVYRRY